MELSFEISEEELPVYLAETDDQLQLLDEGLLQLERQGESMELLQSLFRAAHTLKGAAGMIAHKRMVALTHSMETAFDGLRKQSYTASPELIDVCFEAIDALRKLREEVVEGKKSDVEIEPLTNRFAELVDTLTQNDQVIIQEEQSSSRQPISDNTPAMIKGQINIEADISPNSIASAARAFQIIMALQGLGEITYIEPSQEIVESARPVKHLSAHLVSEKSIAVIRKDLDMISEIDKLVIEKIDNPQSETTYEQATAIGVQEGEDINKERTQSTGQTEIKDSTSKPHLTAEKTVRTSVERLDNLMNLVGELITDRNRLNQIRTTFEAKFRGMEEVETLTGTITHISRITDQLQGEVMGIRMVPIANVFNKFPRMVRDLANKLNKEIDMVVEGEETELDRSLIELINDPLIHLLRNSVDHGIENPNDRIVRKKPRRGKVLLKAEHEQGRIIITVEDDGNGINAKALREKAIKKGFISEADAASMSDEDAINLIFYSGFTTASEVSDVSGRGVGMDIVRNNIQRLGGSITVETWQGRGSRFEVILPLTLAIVQTLLVRIGENRLAIPLVTVMSTLGIQKEDIQTINGKPVILQREKVLPILPLMEVFNFTDSDVAGTFYKYVVIVSIGKYQVGLLVDRLLGEEEVVVKSLGPLIGEITGISSAAILGDGHVILIVDVQDLLRFAGIAQY